ncbi:hypothetical protein [Microcystis sp. BLCC-F210]|uniref:hypothetical protein n=1 Tax=Microcystis sp. BLCC-F210 TaxID=3342751 RepID=UPI0035C9378B
MNYELGKWGSGEVEKWGSGEVGKWGSGEAAILILRFHDIKTLAPRGVNNS